ncbi:translation initiation factor IF-2 subunit beta [Candidatus Pacearchaeota archaeon]|nr:translation initiation factor IF-2 subunit beta [Candidatus Pacearchaeota archaeon]
MADDYESMLGEAYKSIKPTEFCDRFEVKKVEGHHEGTKTIITNFAQVVQCLRRDADHVSRYLFKELATPGNIEGDRLIFIRKMPSKMVNDKIEKYVENFVKCSTCGKPDTEIITESGKTFLKCMACGLKKEIHNI